MAKPRLPPQRRRHPINRRDALKPEVASLTLAASHSMYSASFRSLRGLFSHESGGWNCRQIRCFGGFGEFAIGRWIAVEALPFDSIQVFVVFDANGVVFLAESAAGFVAHFLGGGDFTVEPAKQIHHF